MSITQNQLRKMAPPEIEDLLTEAADAYYDKVDLSPIEVYLDPQYARRALADWARNKFSIAIKADEIAEGSESEVKEVIYSKVRAAYAQREMYYPVETILSQAFGSAGTDNVYACQADRRLGERQVPRRLGRTSGSPAGRVDAIANELVQARRRIPRGRPAGAGDRRGPEPLTATTATASWPNGPASGSAGPWMRRPLHSSETGRPRGSAQRRPSNWPAGS